MDRCPFAGIGTGPRYAGSFCQGAKLPRGRKQQRTPFLLRCGISSESREASRSRHRVIVKHQGSIARGRRPNRREAQEHLPRLLSFEQSARYPADKGALFHDHRAALSIYRWSERKSRSRSNSQRSATCPQENPRHSNTASRKRRSICAYRPKGCPLASAARSFCEKPGRSTWPGRSTIGCPPRVCRRHREFKARSRPA